MTTVLVTLLAVVVALGVVLAAERRVGSRTESPVDHRQGPAPDSAT